MIEGSDHKATFCNVSHSEVGSRFVAKCTRIVCHFM